MSQTTMYAAPEGGTFRAIAEFPNAWGSAMYVWSALGRKYKGDDCYVLFHGDEFWPLWKDPRLTAAERIAMLSTFDKCLIHLEDAPQVAAAFRQFVREHPPKPGVTCHLPAMADVLDGLSGRVLEFKPFAIGWHQTSVSENHWGWVRTGEDEGREYSLATDTDHFFLFDEFGKA